MSDPLREPTFLILLLLAYPKRYRRERGRELVELYRELSGERRRPRPAAFELRPDSTESGDSFGPFATFFVCAYAGWLVTAVIAAVSPGLVLVGVALRLGRAPVPELKSFVRFALVVLGLAALARPTVPSWPARLAPVAAATVTGVAAVAYRVSGMNEIAGCVAGLLVMLLTAVVIPLLAGRLVLFARKRAPAEGPVR